MSIVDYAFVIGSGFLICLGLTIVVSDGVETVASYIEHRKGGRGS